MKQLPLFLLTCVALAACAKNLPVDLSNAVKKGGVNIDGEYITVFKQEDNKWAAYGGENSKDPKRYITYRKERAIELKSGCRIDKRLSGVLDHILIAHVKCG